MNKHIRLISIYTPLVLCLLAAFSLVTVKSYGSGNVAPSATFTISGGGSGAYGFDTQVNDEIYPGCTATPFAWLSGGGYIDITWSSSQTIDELIIYRGNRPYTSFTLQYWNGSSFVNTGYSYSGSSACTQSHPFSAVTTTILRINAVVGSNPNFHEIEVISAGCPTLPQTEDFSGGALPSEWNSSFTTGDGWRFTGNPGWDAVFGDAGNNNRANGTHAWIDFSSTDVGVILESPEWCTGGPATAVLTFSVFSYHSQAMTGDNLLYVEEYNGTSWNSVVTIQQNILDWQTGMGPYTLTGYPDGLGQTTVKFRFRGEQGGDVNDYYNDLLIDDIDVQTPCSGTPTPGSSTTSSNSVSYGATITLSNTGASSDGGITYQWQESTDNAIWSDISGATSTAYVATVLASTYYRLKVTCTISGLSDVANVAAIVNVVPSTPPVVMCSM